MESIFISIVSFNEDLLEETILSAITNSSHPERIYFGVVEQNPDENFLDIKIDNLKHIKINSSTPLGVGASRNLSMKLIEDQKYCLVIDSHSVFEKNWDENLIRRLKFIENIEGEKSLISQRMFGGRIESNKINKDFDRPVPSIMKFNGLIISNDSPITKDYQEHYSASCHFIFCRSEVLKDIEFDPRIYYLAEEPMISMRLVTRGYRIFGLNYIPLVSLNKLSSDINYGWRSLADKNKMIEDFQILIDAFYKKHTGYWWAKDINSLELFINKSEIDISAPFVFLNCPVINQESIYLIKEKMNEVFSNNDFNYSISYIINACTLVDGDKN